MAKPRSVIRDRGVKGFTFDPYIPRADVETWREAEELARLQSRSLSPLLTEALRRYVRPRLTKARNRAK